MYYILTNYLFFLPFSCDIMYVGIVVDISSTNDGVLVISNRNQL